MVAANYSLFSISKTQENSIEYLIFKMVNANQDIIEKNCWDHLAIHNFVSYSHDYIGAKHKAFVAFITKMLRMGHDIDHQDDLGQTALHMAVHYRNDTALSVLLMFGADLNIVDCKGNSPIYYNSLLDYPNNKIIEHLLNMRICELYVSDQNASLVKASYSSSKKKAKFCNDFKKIPRSLLSETGVLAKYPFMRPRQRKLVDEMFESNHQYEMKQRRESLAGLLRLQQNKAKKRIKLVGSAMQALRELFEFVLPELCLEGILLFLSNNELEKLIEL